MSTLDLNTFFSPRTDNRARAVHNQRWDLNELQPAIEVPLSQLLDPSDPQYVLTPEVKHLILPLGRNCRNYDDAVYPRYTIYSSGEWKDKHPDKSDLHLAQIWYEKQFEQECSDPNHNRGPCHCHFAPMLLQAFVTWVVCGRLAGQLESLTADRRDFPYSFRRWRFNFPKLIELNISCVDKQGASYYFSRPLYANDDSAKVEFSMNQVKKLNLSVFKTGTMGPIGIGGPSEFELWASRVLALLPALNASSINYGNVVSASDVHATSTIFELEPSQNVLNSDPFLKTVTNAFSESLSNSCTAPPTTALDSHQKEAKEETKEEKEEVALWIADYEQKEDLQQSTATCLKDDEWTVLYGDTGAAMATPPSAVSADQKIDVSTVSVDFNVSEELHRQLCEPCLTGPNSNLTAVDASIPASAVDGIAVSQNLLSTFSHLRFLARSCCDV
jgi:hypothetical protein